MRFHIVQSFGRPKRKHTKHHLKHKQSLVETGSKREPPELITTATENACCSATQNTCCKDDDDDDQEVTKRLVVYFNFEKVEEKKNKITDKSGYDNNGKMSHGVEILKFNDPDYSCNQGARIWDSEITLNGDNFQAKPTKAVTVAAWIKLEETPGYHTIFSTIGRTHELGQYHFEVNNEIVRWFHRNEYQQTVFDAQSHKVVQGNWTHVAGTYNSNSTQAKIFINGELRNQSIGTGKLSRDWDVFAGIGNYLKQRPLRGAIDEFRMYNYALTPEEVQALVSVCRKDQSSPPAVKSDGVKANPNPDEKSDEGGQAKRVLNPPVKKTSPKKSNSKATTEDDK